MSAVSAARLQAVMCANGCGTAIDQPKTGRPRKTCSDRCRQQLRQRRRALPWPPVAPPGYPTDPEAVKRRTVEALVELLDGREPAPPEDQLAQGLLELDWIAYALAALEKDLAPALGARAAELARRIRLARKAAFPEIDEVQV